MFYFTVAYRDLGCPDDQGNIGEGGKGKRRVGNNNGNNNNNSRGNGKMAAMILAMEMAITTTEEMVKAGGHGFGYRNGNHKNG